jgi:hypothetical protein
MRRIIDVSSKSAGHTRLGRRIVPESWLVVRVGRCAGRCAARPERIILDPVYRGNKDR